MEIPGVGHNTHFEAPDIFCETVQEFFAS
jgi:pimeloyl-ACP methyl ester carboxylesterase